MQKLKCQQANS